MKEWQERIICHKYTSTNKIQRVKENKIIHSMRESCVRNFTYNLLVALNRVLHPLCLNNCFIFAILNYGFSVFTWHHTLMEEQLRSHVHFFDNYDLLHARPSIQNLTTAQVWLLISWTRVIVKKSKIKVFITSFTNDAKVSYDTIQTNNGIEPDSQSKNKEGVKERNFN